MSVAPLVPLPSVFDFCLRRVSPPNPEMLHTGLTSGMTLEDKFPIYGSLMGLPCTPLTAIGTLMKTVNINFCANKVRLPHIISISILIYLSLVTALSIGINYIRKLLYIFSCFSLQPEKSLLNQVTFKVLLL